MLEWDTPRSDKRSFPTEVEIEAFDTLLADSARRNRQIEDGLATAWRFARAFLGIGPRDWRAVPPPPSPSAADRIRFDDWIDAAPRFLTWSFYHHSPAERIERYREQHARDLIAINKAEAAILGEHLVWKSPMDALVDLYVSTRPTRGVGVLSHCRSRPSATAHMRLIKGLVSEGLARSWRDQHGCETVTLSPGGRSTAEQYLDLSLRLHCPEDLRRVLGSVQAPLRERPSRGQGRRQPWRGQLRPEVPKLL